MANEQTLISGIENKVKELIDQFDSIRHENRELHQHIDVLNQKVEALTNELENKRNELLTISLASTLELQYGVEDSKTKIDDLINEIDQCIEVLSD